MDYEVKTELNGLYMHFNFVRDGVVLGTGQVHLEQNGHLGVVADPRFSTAQKLAAIAGKYLEPLKAHIDTKAGDDTSWPEPITEE